MAAIPEPQSPSTAVHPVFSPRVKTGVFVLEALNSFAVILYLTYIFFYLRDRFGFGNLENLTFCTVHGALYAAWVWQAGRFAQRRGYFLALKVGFAVMGVALLAGTQAASVAAHYAVLVVWTLGVGLTWPALEAITSEHEPPGRLQRQLGIYNVVWATGGGVATFLGGGLLERLGPRSIFAVPVVLHVVQFILATALESANRRGPGTAAANPTGPTGPAVPAGRGECRRSPVSPRTFLMMSWVANPFAYVAMTAVLPVIPGLARKFELTATWAGVFCSVWLLARATGFWVLWHWTAWHYRFRWLMAAYVGVTGCFAIILLGNHLWLLVGAQVVFGLGVALIYYSSLYYSMDVGDTKGEHGGLHEAAIGAGIFGGPAVGAASLYFLPGQPNMNAWAVTALLLVGLGWLAALRRRGRQG